jgi:hypothetical protein
VIVYTPVIPATQEVDWEASLRKKLERPHLNFFKKLGMVAYIYPSYPGGIGSRIKL